MSTHERPLFQQQNNLILNMNVLNFDVLTFLSLLIGKEIRLYEEVIYHLEVFLS